MLPSVLVTVTSCDPGSFAGVEHVRLVALVNVTLVQGLPPTVTVELLVHVVPLPGSEIAEGDVGRAGRPRGGEDGGLRRVAGEDFARIEQAAADPDLDVRREAAAGDGRARAACPRTVGRLEAGDGEGGPEVDLVVDSRIVPEG